jgi:hypothetical protein
MLDAACFLLYWLKQSIAVGEEEVVAADPFPLAVEEHAYYRFVEQLYQLYQEQEQMALLVPAVLHQNTELAGHHFVVEARLGLVGYTQVVGELGRIADGVALAEDLRPSVEQVADYRRVVAVLVEEERVVGHIQHQVEEVHPFVAFQEAVVGHTHQQVEAVRPFVAFPEVVVDHSHQQVEAVQPFVAFREVVVDHSHQQVEAAQPFVAFQEAVVHPFEALQEAADHHEDPHVAVSSGHVHQVHREELVLQVQHLDSAQNS